MPRKGEVRRREVLPDPKYHDRLVTKFINSMMERGKKSLAERMLYGGLDLIAENIDGTCSIAPRSTTNRDAAPKRGR